MALEEVDGGMLLAVFTPFLCQHCRQPFNAQRTTARFCSARCRVAWNRANLLR
jgi:hypothetical protein